MIDARRAMAGNRARKSSAKRENPLLVTRRCEPHPLPSATCKATPGRPELEARGRARPRAEEMVRVQARGGSHDPHVSAPAGS
jgi:hypothetical protein